VRLLAGDQELGGLGVGVQRVGGDDHPSKVQGCKQRGEGGDLLGRAADLALGQHLAGGVVHRRQQVHRAAVTVGWVGAAQGLAVDGDRPPPAGHPTGTLLVGQPGADRAGDCVGVQAAEGAADGGLGRDGEAAGGLLAGAQGGPDRLGRIGGPFGDRGDRPGAGQDRDGGQAQDRHQRVAAASGSSRVRDRGQAGQQVPGVGLLELASIGLGELGQRGWDRG
jgi:hypothetical protein